MPEEDTQFVEMKIEEDAAREAHLFLHEWLHGKTIAADRERIHTVVKRFEEQFGTIEG